MTGELYHSVGPDMVLVCNCSLDCTSRKSALHSLNSVNIQPFMQQIYDLVWGDMSPVRKRLVRLH